MNNKQELSDQLNRLRLVSSELDSILIVLADSKITEGDREALFFGWNTMQKKVTGLLSDTRRLLVEAT